jgi:hypothetical protein
MSFFRSSSESEARSGRGSNVPPFVVGRVNLNLRL